MLTDCKPQDEAKPERARLVASVPAGRRRLPFLGAFLAAVVFVCLLLLIWFL